MWSVTFVSGQKLRERERERGLACCFPFLYLPFLYKFSKFFFLRKLIWMIPPSYLLITTAACADDRLIWGRADHAAVTDALFLPLSNVIFDTAHSSSLHNRRSRLCWRSPRHLSWMTDIYNSICCFWESAVNSATLHVHAARRPASVSPANVQPGKSVELSTANHSMKKPDEFAQPSLDAAHGRCIAVLFSYFQHLYISHFLFLLWEADISSNLVAKGHVSLCSHPG